MKHQLPHQLTSRARDQARAWLGNANATTQQRYIAKQALKSIGAR